VAAHDDCKGAAVGVGREPVRSRKTMLYANAGQVYIVLQVARASERQSCGMIHATPCRRK